MSYEKDGSYEEAQYNLGHSEGMLGGFRQRDQRAKPSAFFASPERERGMQHGYEAGKNLHDTLSFVGLLVMGGTAAVSALWNLVSGEKKPEGNSPDKDGIIRDQQRVIDDQRRELEELRRQQASTNNQSAAPTRRM